MLKKSKVLSSVALLGLLSSAYATDARIEAMGKNSRFIMDDISIFDNPANIGLYPNFLIGEFGSFKSNQLTPGTNLDPQQPWFGGVFGLGLAEDPTQHPKLLIAGAFNRVDEGLNALIPSKVLAPAGIYADSVAIPGTATNFDGFLGFSSPMGNLFASHIFVALQNGGDGQGYVNPAAYNAQLRFDLGTNFKLTEDADWEVTLGASRVHFGADSTNFWDMSNWGGRISTRITNTFDFLHGELVPQGNYEIRKADGRSLTDFDAGLGLQVNMDRNLFFWIGSEYFFQEDRAAGYSYISSKVDGQTVQSVFKDQRSEENWDYKGDAVSKEYGGRISFGIERNLWTNWFLIRVGGSKKISWKECQPAAGQDRGFCGERGSYYSTNAYGDGSKDDHVGFGFGINVEEKLKVDAVVAEDLLYRNPFQGGGRMLSRISASYQF